jgi:hypothetical protein
MTQEIAAGDARGTHHQRFSSLAHIADPVSMPRTS